VILAAGLLVLLGLGLFVAGILTGMTALYWGCVAACVVAAVLLFRARRQLTAASRTAAGPWGPAAGAATDRAATGRPATDRAATDRAATDRAATDRAPAGAAGPTAASTAGAPAEAAEPDDPPIEEVEVTDLLMVVDLKDEVLVVDEHPRYHLAGCVYLTGRTTIPVPLDEARTDGFTPCAVCTPDRALAQRARERKADGNS
jgi:hypothetical protein